MTLSVPTQQTDEPRYFADCVASNQDPVQIVWHHFKMWLRLRIITYNLDVYLDYLFIISLTYLPLVCDHQLIM